MKKKYSFDKYFSHDDVIGDILFLGAYIILLLTTIIKKFPKD